MSTVFVEGSWARVRLRADCPGDGRWPHRPDEQDCRVQVTSAGHDGDHSVFVLYQDSELGFGRYFRPDELEPILPPQ
jgi:hypothetical protein